MTKLRVVLYLSVSIIFILFFAGIIQTKHHETRLWNDLKTKAASVGESIAISGEHEIAIGDKNETDRIVKSFEGRKRTQGCVIYRADGTILSASGRFGAESEQDAVQVMEIIKEGKSRLFEKNIENKTLTYLTPVQSGGRIVGAIEIIYDTAYIPERINDYWQRLILIAAVLIVIFSFITFVLLERNFIVPSRQFYELTERLKNRGVLNKEGTFSQFDEIMRQLEDNTLYYAFTDNKTGLRNYYYYSKIISEVLKEGRGFCLAVADIDDFKNFNTVHGHDSGDYAVRAVAAVLASNAGSDVCRYGGEEFVFIAKSNIDDFKKFCNRVVAEVEIEAGGKVEKDIGVKPERPITISIGIASVDELGPVSREYKNRELFKLADKRMLKAKINGKNQVCSE